MIEPKNCFVTYNCTHRSDDGHNCNGVEINTNFCPRLFKINKLYDLALLTDYQKKRISKKIPKEDKAIYSELNDYENNIVNNVFNGNSLYIHSHKCGNGKTMWSIRLLQTYLCSIWSNSDICCRALFINVPKYFAELKSNISDKSDYIEYINANVRKADLVVWDDIGSKMGTEFEIENLLNIINDRINLNKCNIYTSNMTPDELRKRIGDRLCSRVVNVSTVYEFKSSDMRGVK